MLPDLEEIEWEDLDHDINFPKPIYIGIDVGERNMAFCAIHRLGGNTHILRIEKHDLGLTKPQQAKHLPELLTRFMLECHRLVEFQYVEFHVGVEQQFARYKYLEFACQVTVNMFSDDMHPAKPYLISGSSKYRPMRVPGRPFPKDYNKRKKLAVHYFLERSGVDPDWLHSHMEKHKKLDDEADAYLVALETHHRVKK